MKNIKQMVFYAKKSIQKLRGIIAGTIWFDNDDQDEIDALSTLAIKKAGFKRSDFFKPVRVDHLVVDDMPLEGVFDTAFCDRYKLAEDGKSWLLPATQPGSTDSGTGENTDSISEGHTDENTTDNADSGDTTSAADATAAGSTDAAASTPAYEYNVNGEPMAEVMKKMDWPVVEMSLPMRWMAQMGKDKKVIHLSPEQYGRVMAMTAPQDDDEEPLLNNINLMLVGDMAADIDKLDAHQLFRLVKAVEKVAQKDGRMGLHLLCRFVRAWLDTEYIDQGILVKSWCEGKRISRVEKMQQTTAGDTSDLQNAKDGETGASTRPRRSEKPTHRTINYELGCGFYDDLDFDNLRPAMDFAKRIIAEDREDWKRMSITAGIIPDIKEFDRQTIIDLVRKAPKAVLTGSPELRRTWCESFLAVHGVRDPDWYEYVPNKAATTHEENLETVRKAGKCLRDIEAGRFQHEEETQPTGTLADEPAAPETVEPDTTKHHQDSQQVETKSSVAVTDDGDQSQREQASKQLAAERGDFVPGISDPSDPKRVHNDYSASASNEGEKKEVATDSAADTADYVDHQEAFSNQYEPENNHSEPSTNHNEPEAPETGPKSQQPEPVTKVADGVFDVSAFFADTSNQVEKTEDSPSNNDGRTTKKTEESSPDKAANESDKSDSTPEMILLLRQSNQTLQQILISQLRIEKAHRKDAAAIRGMLAMMYAAETEETEEEISHEE
ncbi:hypothetical protein P8M99_002646 [Salmonella enterica]|nr:hypothetical protein [Salmonella enterica]ELD3568552.1 hypothetical protein [Salmonella enterica]